MMGSSEHNQYLSYGNIVEYLNPALFMTMANKEDNPTYREAMSSPNKVGFIAAVEKEILTLMDLDVYDLVDITPDKKIFSDVWALQQKQYPDVLLKQLKARLCAYGFEQIKGVDYFETYSPVVMWITVQLLLDMSILLNLDTTQIDYTAAFIHASINCLVYVECSKGFVAEGKCWKLKKSLYGLARSPQNYFLYTNKKLIKMGFYQSDADPCLFISKDVIVRIYIDDALYFYKDELAISDLKGKMVDKGILLREEDGVASYLGVQIERKKDSSIVLTQPGLAERIVDVLHLNDDTVDLSLLHVLNIWLLMKMVN